MLINLEASDETMKGRLEGRAAAATGAANDEAGATKEKLAADIAAGLASFHENQPAIVDHYDKQGKMHKVNANQDAQAVFDEIKAIMGAENGMLEADDSLQLQQKANEDKPSGGILS